MSRNFRLRLCLPGTERSQQRGLSRPRRHSQWVTTNHVQAVLRTGWESGHRKCRERSEGQRWREMLRRKSRRRSCTSSPQPSTLTRVVSIGRMRTCVCRIGTSSQVCVATFLAHALSLVGQTGDAASRISSRERGDALTGISKMTNIRRSTRSSR
jgi:hypothetical protein